MDCIQVGAKAPDPYVGSGGGTCRPLYSHEFCIGGAFWLLWGTIADVGGSPFSVKYTDEGSAREALADCESNWWQYETFSLEKVEY